MQLLGVEGVFGGWKILGSAVFIQMALAWSLGATKLHGHIIHFHIKK